MVQTGQHHSLFDQCFTLSTSVEVNAQQVLVYQSVYGDR